MKSILDKNKEAIKLIVSKCSSDEWKDYQFYSVFHSIYKRSVLLLPNECQGIELYDREKSYLTNRKKHKNIIFDAYIPLIELVNLFRYLEKNNLISFIPYYGTEWIGNEIEDFKIIHSSINNDKLKEEELNKKRFTIKDESVIKYLNDKYSCLISISPELHDLVQNDFKTIEQRNHIEAMRKANNQIRLAWGALLFAFISIIASTCSKNNDTIDVKSAQIEQQLDKIINQMAIPDTIKTEIINDTLKVIVIKPKKSKSKTAK